MMEEPRQKGVRALGVRRGEGKELDGCSLGLYEPGGEEQEEGADCVWFSHSLPFTLNAEGGCVGAGPSDLLCEGCGGSRKVEAVKVEQSGRLDSSLGKRRKSHGVGAGGQGALEGSPDLQLES